MFIARAILSPFALIYAMGVWLRNQLYITGILSRTEFDLPIICVGNLSAGGTGKTPHIGWLIKELLPIYKLALLSRGYGRKTIGYVAAASNSRAEDIGDEPMLLYQKYNINTVACENRVLGVPNLLADFPDTDCILMDDGYQHLAIKPGLTILLTDYSHLFTRDYLLPAGRLREFRNGYKRAHIIIVSKCPMYLSKQQKEYIIKEIAPLPHQKVFFTGIYYKPIQYASGELAVLDKNSKIVLITGIADATLIKDKLSTDYTLLHHFEYSDHKPYTDEHVRRWLQMIEEVPGGAQLVCTEKDWIKLNGFNTDLKKHMLILPIEIIINDHEKHELITDIRKYIDSYRTI
jgi:tetraacyldisaccharide 4'-kinase